MYLLKWASRRVLIVAVAMIVPVVAGVTPAYAGSWQIVTTPNPTGNDGFATLTEISPANLWAVGSATSLSSSSATLTAHYNGTSWQVVSSPSPAGGRYDDLTGVSGTSASDIWSVGMEFVKAGHSYPIIEHYNGSAWSLVTSAEPAQVGDLSAVAALTPANVWAVGDGHTPAGVDAPMIQHYDGTGWTEVSTPVTTAGLLTGVSAVSATDVWAVGSQPVPSGIGRSGLVMHYDGTSWTVSALPPPNVPVNGEWELSSVSADSASDVWATGFVSDATGLGQHVVVEHFNGTSWTVQPAPGLSGQSVLSFDGLAATGSGTLWSVGSRNPAGTSVWQTLNAEYS